MKTKYFIFSSLLLCFILAIDIKLSAQEWTITDVGNGTKPEMVVDSFGNAHITYMFESVFNGRVDYAFGNQEGFENTLIQEGYFYAPSGIALDNNGIPRIVYHDHGVENLVQSRQLPDGSFLTETISSTGHDGWNPSIAIDFQNRSHIISMDNANGIEYAIQNGGAWDQSRLYDERVRYEWGTDIYIQNSLFKHATWYVSTTGDMYYAHQNNGVWTNQIVPDGGAFPCFSLTSDFQPAISYLEINDDGSSGAFFISVYDGTTWQREQLARLEFIDIGFSGARDLQRLVIKNGVWHYAYSNKFQIMYATKADGASWRHEQVVNVAANGETLGQHIDLDVDEEGNVSITYYINASSSSRDGFVKYAYKPVTEPTGTLNIACPSPTTVICNLDPDESETGIPSIIEAIGSSIDFQHTDQVFNAACALNGDTIRRTWIATNELGHDTSCEQIITSIMDESLISFPQNTTLDMCYEDFIQSTNLEMPNISCDMELLIDHQDSIENFNCGSVYTIRRQWSITDECNNLISQQLQTILLDNINGINISDESINPDSGASDGFIEISASCGIEPYQYIWSDGGVGNMRSDLSTGVYNVTVTDRYGCTQSANFEIPSGSMINLVGGNILDQLGNEIADLNVTLNNITTGESINACDTNGQLNFCGINQGSPNDIFELCISKTGPIDQGISAVDVVKATRIILGLTNSSCVEDVIALDVDGSGAGSARDLVIMRQAALGIIDEFPNDRNWVFLRNLQEFDCLRFQRSELPLTNLEIKAVKLGDLKCAEQNVLNPTTNK